MSDTPPPDATKYVQVNFYITEENYLAIHQAIVEGGLENASDFYQQAMHFFLCNADQARKLKRLALIDDEDDTASPIGFEPLDLIYQKALERQKQEETTPPPPPKGSHLKVVK